MMINFYCQLDWLDRYLVYLASIRLVVSGWVIGYGLGSFMWSLTLSTLVLFCSLLLKCQELMSFPLPHSFAMMFLPWS